MAIVAVVKILPLMPAAAIRSYHQWIPYAFIVTLIGIALTSITGMLFYRQQITDLLDIVRRIVRSGGGRGNGIR